MTFTQTELEMIHTGLLASAENYDRLYHSTNPPLNGLKTIAKRFQKLARKVRKEFHCDC